MSTIANDPELDGKFLGRITSDFVKIADPLKEAAYLLRNREISAYPIFVLCQTQQSIGQLLHHRDEEGLDWNYYFSMAEEFVARGLLSNEGFDLFKSTYKDPDEFACLFVVDPEFTQFVFVPYPED